MSSGSVRDLFLTFGYPASILRFSSESDTETNGSPGDVHM